MKLWRYIQGNRKGKEAHRLEKESMTDPFLADALDGFDKVNGNHTEHIKMLREQVRIKSKRKNKYIRTLSIAASILIVMGVGTYFWVKETGLSDDMQIAYEDLAFDAPPQIPPVPVTNNKENALALHKKQEKEQVRREEVAPVIAQAMQADASSPVSVVEKADEIVPEEMDSGIMMNEVARKVKQPLTVKGRVVDTTGEPITGAVVTADDTMKGTLTNPEGYFELVTNDNENIRVNYIGYEPISIPVDTNKVMLIAMNEDTQALNEVVVVAHGAKKKSVLRLPEPSIGKKAFESYLKKNLIRPTDDDCREAKGKITVGFYVNQQGRPYNITVKKGLCTSADKEAIRLIAEGPDWTIGEREVTVNIKF